LLALGHSGAEYNGFEGVIEELTLSQDQDSGEYTRLTRFHTGTDTTSLGEKSHDYPEEIFIVSGHIYDQVRRLIRSNCS
jgi:hypothetical protein